MDATKWVSYCQDKYGEGTTFSWKTGKIERGRIHNPHYLDYMRKNESHIREVGDVHCGGLPNMHRMDYMLRIYKYDGQREVICLLRIALEINQYIIDPLREKLRIQNIHKMTQIKYLIGEINDKQSVNPYQKKNKNRKTRRFLIYTISAILTENINDVYNNIYDVQKLDDLCDFAQNFIQMENAHIVNVSYNYKLTVPYIAYNPNNKQNPWSRETIKVSTKKDLQKYIINNCKDNKTTKLTGTNGTAGIVGTVGNPIAIY